MTSLCTFVTEPILRITEGDTVAIPTRDELLAAVDQTFRAQHPDEPWLWRRDWAERVVRESPDFGGWCLWGFAILWNLFCVPVWFIVPWEWPADAKASAPSMIDPSLTKEAIASPPVPKASCCTPGPPSALA